MQRTKTGQRSSAPGQNPSCHLLGPTTGYYKGFFQQVSWGKTALLTFGAQAMNYSLLEGIVVKNLRLRLHPTRAMRITRSAFLDQASPFGSFFEWFLLHTPDFCSVLFSRETISPFCPACHVIDPCTQCYSLWKDGTGASTLLLGLLPTLSQLVNKDLIVAFSSACCPSWPPQHLTVWHKILWKRTKLEDFHYLSSRFLQNYNSQESVILAIGNKQKNRSK